MHDVSQAFVLVLQLYFLNIELNGLRMTSDVLEHIIKNDKASDYMTMSG